MGGRTSIAAGVWAALLVALLAIGARGIGTLPALGPLLDPAKGVWQVATSAQRSSHETVAVPGMRDSVEVIFDDRGVPHVFASNPEHSATS